MPTSASDRPNASAVPAPDTETEVWAAGAILRRERGAGVQVLIVHRPHRRDWSLPKGKVDPGETLAQTAVREVREETGYECELGDQIAALRYIDAGRRAKEVVYFDGRVVGGRFEPNAEVDEIRWCSPLEAVALLTYPRDRQLVVDRFRPG